MPWTSGSFSRVHDWTTDEAGGTDMEADRFDAEDDNFADGIDACLHKGGQNTPTANLPMDGNRHTGVGNGAARDDYVAVNQIQDGDLYVVGSVAGTDTITGSMTPAITAYTNGMRVLFLPAANNTGAATLNLNSVGAQSITKLGTTALAADDLVSGVWADCVYDSANTNWILLNPQATYANRSNNLSDLASASTARTNLGLGTAAVEADTRYNHRANNLSDVASPTTARANLGVAIGSDVQAFDAQLADIAALAVTDGNFIVGDGLNWVAESGATARTSLGLGSAATQDDTRYNHRTNNLSDVSNAATARTNLGVAIGTNVQAWDAQLDDIAALAVTNGNFIVGNGTAWVAESGSTARTSLGLGSAATQADTRYNHRTNNLSDVSNASTARTNLGVAIGSDVQAFDAHLDDLAALGTATGADQVMVSTGAGAWALESGATLRTSLGLGTGDSPTFTNMTLNGSSFDPGSASVTTDNDTADEVGFKGAPQNIQNGNYTLVLADAGNQIYKASGGAGETITIPANSSVAFPIGTIIEIINDGGGDLSIAITTDTLEPYGGTAGTQTLPDNNKAIIEKVTSTLWKYQATG